MAGTGLRFTERMQGSIASGLSDDAYEIDGGLGWAPFDFVLQAEVEDVAAFVRSPEHPIHLPRGVVHSDHFGRCQVIDGEINLLVEGREPDDRIMRYRVCFQTEHGPMTLLGFKAVDGDRLHLWYDTTRVFAEIYEGRLDSARPGDARLVAVGILEIPMLTFLIQLTTFRPVGGGGAGKVMALVRFFVYFTRALAKPYLLGLLTRIRVDVATARQPLTTEVLAAGHRRFMETD